MLTNKLLMPPFRYGFNNKDSWDGGPWNAQSDDATSACVRGKGDWHFALVNAQNSQKDTMAVATLFAGSPRLAQAAADALLKLEAATMLNGADGSTEAGALREALLACGLVEETFEKPKKKRATKKPKGTKTGKRLLMVVRNNRAA